MLIRAAVVADGPALRALDVATWAPTVSPAPRPDPSDDRPFFGDGLEPGDVLVAADGPSTVGYVALARPTPLATNAHVWTVTGLAVGPGAQGRGIGRALLGAAADEARARGGRRLTLRVFAVNAPARALYARCGFVEEGRLREEFLVDGAYVDDLQLAIDLTGRRPPRQDGGPGGGGLA